VSMESQGWVGLALVRIAAVYLVIALVLGLAMAVRQDFSLASVHSHLGLLGWASMGLAGIVYLVLPRTGRSRLAVVHFWLHNVGLPVMLGALAVLHLSDDSRAEPLVGLGSLPSWSSPSTSSGTGPGTRSPAARRRAGSEPGGSRRDRRTAPLQPSGRRPSEPLQRNGFSARTVP
jgi:hypothetical protein